jgi:hypothetical protein
MRTTVHGFPILMKISAISIGVPLIVFGIVLMAVDVLGQLRILSSSVAPLSGFAIGPIFALVGASFLYPLVALGARPRETKRR